MSDGVRHVQPTQAPADSRPVGGAVDAYTRAVQSRPTNFADNPLGAMASAMDKIGKAAGGLLHKPEADPAARLQAAEARLNQATEAARANPHSMAAKQEQLKAGLELLREMQTSAPNDPRRVRLAGLVVSLGSQLGPGGIPFNVPGLDVRGLLRLAAQITSRFGDANGMKAAFGLEALLRSTLGGSSVEAMQLRDQLMRKFQISTQAQQTLVHSWKIKLAGAGEQPQVDVSSRTISLNASKENQSMAALAKAFWHDNSMSNPGDKDGFMKAFLKLASSGGGFGVLQRKYKELRTMARHQVMTAPQFERVGRSESGVLGVSRPTQQDDDGADMFAALALFSQTPEGRQLPDSVRESLGRFFVTAR